MESDALLEAFRDFEKKGKKDTCPVLEQFLCHVAKTGQPMIPWSQFKPYFMFKLEKVMDDFHASAPEQRRQHNPNVDFVPFEEMKKRILKIVDGYIGIPFTIQRLCELLTDPKRNYTGTEKFLMGLEKNVMVVSCVYPTSEKNGAVSVNKVNGVMFPGTSPLYADSRNVNGPGLPRSLNRPKLSACDSCSTNGLPDCSVTEQPEPTTEETEGHLISSASSTSEGAIIPSSGKKNKQTEEDSDADQHEVKKLKLDENGETESEEKESSHLKELESFSGTTESSNNSCSQENESVTSDGKSISEDHAPSITQTDASTRRDDSSETGDVLNRDRESSEDQRELPVSLQIDASFERENVKDGGDGEGLPRDKQVSSSSNSSDLSTEGSTEISNNSNTAIDPGDHS